MSTIADLSPVWREYLRTARFNRNTRIVESEIHFGSGIVVDLAKLKRDIPFADARKVIAVAYTNQITKAKQYKKYKFPERKRQKRLEGYTVQGLQKLSIPQFAQAVNRITTGSAVFAGAN